MRIIAGKHRGRRLATPKGDAIRPTTDRIRESLFSILGDLHDAVVIDGYAGTGALGCEALSRGAKKVWFFDTSRAAVELVRQNVEAIGEEEATVLRQANFAEGLVLVDEPVDLVFLDPPYGTGEPQLALEALAKSSAVGTGARVVLEQARGDELPTHDDFLLTDTRTYGTTRLSFFDRR